MADQLRWWKLWETALSDEKLRALPMEDCWRWAVLGVWLRVHGDGGSGFSPTPHEALADIFRMVARGGRRGAREQLAERVREILRRLPGVDVADVPGGITVRMRHWHKYQEDSSATRTRAWRDRQRQRDGQQTVTPTVTRDGQPASRETEQTRRDETRSPLSPLSPPTQIRHDWPPGVDHRATDWLPGRWPYETFHHDCPERAWRGHCVRAEYADAHPGQHPVTMGGRPKQCPKHREAEP